MDIAQKPVRAIVKEAVAGGLLIPEFQREFVWKPDRVRTLVESLDKGYPIGTLLLWDNKEYAAAKGGRGKQLHKWIVDGQQRVTSLCIVYDHKPFWWPDQESWEETVERNQVLVNVCPTNSKDHFGLKNPIRSRDPRWCPVTDILNLENEEAVTTYATDVTDQVNQLGDERKFADIYAILRSVWDIGKEDVAIVTVLQRIKDVVEIFKRLNRQGVSIKESDTTLALISTIHQNWVAKTFLPFSKDLSRGGYKLEPGVLIRTAVGYALGHVRLEDVDETFWRDRFLQAWKRSEDAIRHVIKALQDKGLTAAELLPSKNSLIPLFVMRATYGSKFDFNSAFQWFLIANESGRYGRAAVTQLSDDIKTIRNSETQGEALKTLLSDIDDSWFEFRPVDFMAQYGRAKSLRLMLYLLLFDKKAKDWVSKTRIGFNKSNSKINKGFKPEWHHIFPKHFLKESKWRKSPKINALANITVLNEATNRHELNKLPFKEYVRKFRISTGQLKAHLVPTEPSLRSLDRFEVFLERRAAHLAEEANKYYSRLANSH